MLPVHLHLPASATQSGRVQHSIDGVLISRKRKHTSTQISGEAAIGAFSGTLMNNHANLHQRKEKRRPSAKETYYYKKAEQASEHPLGKETKMPKLKTE